MKNKLSKYIDKKQFFEFTLDHFVKNEANFKELTYIISFYDFIQKYDERRNGAYICFDGYQATFNHIIKNCRYFGNTEMIEWPSKILKERGEYNGLIRCNKNYLFVGATLFVKADGKTYRLKYDGGFLSLDIGARKAPNHNQIQRASNN